MQEPIVPQFGRPDTTPDVATNARVGGGRNNQEGWRGIASTIVILIAAPLVALFLINFVFQSYEVDGPSMETTLSNQDRLIVNKIPRTIARIRGEHYIPHRGDIIIFIKRGLADNSGGEKQLIKRVIGLPGERVVAKDGHLIVYNKEHPIGYNPFPLDKYPGINVDTTGNADFTVKENEVFVSGDNRPNSLDSRLFGPIDTSDIIGKLSWRIFPINKAEHF